MSEPIVDGRSFTAAARGLRAFGDDVDQAAGEALGDIGLEVQENVRSRRARHRVTGKGERFVGLKSTGSGSERVVRVHAGGRVAHLIAGGTRPHTIRPIRGHAIALQRVGGALIGFADAVRHPGTRPDPFVAEGIDDSAGDIDRIADRAADELVDDLARNLGRR